MRRLALIVGTLISLPSLAAPLVFRSVNEPAVLYDTPSTKGVKQWVILRGTPVEAILGLDLWVKVRDSAGTIAWIEKKALGNQRTVIVTTDSAEFHQQADAASPVEFALGKDVVLELQEKLASGWVKVKHREGSVGYLRATDVWGE